MDFKMHVPFPQSANADSLGCSGREDVGGEEQENLRS